MSMRASVIALLLACAPALAAAKKPVVAVFGIENKGTAVSAEVLERLTIYLASKLTESGSFEVVPQDKLKEALVARKTESYKKCFGQSCQIEIGQELAASQALSTQVMKVGSSCVVTENLYDLRTATSNRAATGRGPCSEDGIMASIDGAFTKLAMTPSPEPRRQLVAQPQPGPGPVAAAGHPVAATAPPPSDRPASTPVYKKAWFWIVIGAVVAAGVAVGVVFAVRSSSSGGKISGALTMPDGATPSGAVLFRFR